jgi:hypothetical protein
MVFWRRKNNLSPIIFSLLKKPLPSFLKRGRGRLLPKGEANEFLAT